MTIGLLAAVAYFSLLLNNQGKTAVTQIKKTKASAITYHKLLALNDVNIVAPTDVPTTDVTDNNSSSFSPQTANISPTTALLAYQSTSPTPTPTVAKPTTTPTAIPTVVQTVVSRPTSIPTPTTPLLVYRTLTPTATLIPVQSTGGTQSGVITSPSPTKTTLATNGKTLPETGWVQLSTILFIVAATTVFVSFLF